MERSDPDIVSVIQSLFPEMMFALEDIRHPDPAKIRNLYMHLVNLVLMEENKFVDIPKPGDCNFDETTLQILALYKEVRNLFGKVECSPPVYVGDIMFPSSDSIRKLLSTFINVYAFQEFIEEKVKAQRLQALELKRETEKLEDQLATKEREIHQALVQSQEFKMKEEENQMELNRIADKVLHMEIQRTELKTELAIQENDCHTAEQVLTKLKTQLNEANYPTFQFL